MQRCQSYDFAWTHHIGTPTFYIDIYSERKQEGSTLARKLVKYHCFCEHLALVDELFSL
jgi:hypothetical protein